MADNIAGLTPEHTFAAPAAEPPESRRVVAIDALRGFDMFWIIGGREFALAAVGLFVSPLPSWANYQFEHADWSGFTAWDLIMPLFLFVVGAAMPFSFARRLEEPSPDPSPKGRGSSAKQRLYVKIVRRSVILFILGMAVQGHLLDFDLATLHVYCNTLQAIAAGYLVAGFVMLNMGIRGQLSFALVMLLGYWLLLMHVPLPNDKGGLLLPDANLALSVDELVLGRFRDGTSYTWVLSSMTFTATVLLGVFAGHVLRSAWDPHRKFTALVTMGVASLAAGWAWADWLNFPIIKHIWTSSMVLWAAGWSYLLLAVFYLLVDIWGFRRWAFPFVVIGMNAITIYVANFFVPFRTIAESLVGGLGRHLGTGGPLLIEGAAVLLAWLVVYHLYRQRIFLRI